MTTTLITNSTLNLTAPDVESPFFTCCPRVFLTLSAVLAAVSVPLPVAILFSSRRVTGGPYSVEMIYARAFLVADLLLSAYGILRPLQSWLGHRWADCLLAETLVCSEVLARCSTLTCGTLDARLRSRGYRFTAKSSTTFALILLWNASVATGFLPVVRPRPKGCDPFSVLGTAYLGAFAGVVLLCLTVSAGVLAAGVRYGRSWSHQQSPTTTPTAPDQQHTPHKDPLLGLLWVELGFLAAYCTPCLCYSVYVYSVYHSAKRAYYMLTLSVLLQSKPLLCTLVRCLTNRKLSAIVRGIFRPSSAPTPPNAALAYVIRGVVNEAFVGGGQGVCGEVDDGDDDGEGVKSRKDSHKKAYISNVQSRYSNGRQRSKSVGTPEPRGHRGENGLFPKLKPLPFPLYDPCCPLHGIRSRRRLSRLAPVPAMKERRSSKLCERVDEIAGGDRDKRIASCVHREKEHTAKKRHRDSSEDSNGILREISNERIVVVDDPTSTRSISRLQLSGKTDIPNDNSWTKVDNGFSDVAQGHSGVDVVGISRLSSEGSGGDAGNIEDKVRRHPRTLEVRKLDRKKFLFPGSL